MRGELFDTSVYIAALRGSDAAIFSRRRNEPAGENLPLWLSVVVLEELYVGAGDRKMKKLLGKFGREFGEINRLLVPDRNNWTNCGQVLALIGRKYGFEKVRRARMTNDCLIALSAAARGLTVVTHNAEDFRLIAEFRPFEWREITAED